MYSIALRSALFIGFSIALSGCDEIEVYNLERIVNLDSQQQENTFGIVALDETRLLVSIPFRHELRVYNATNGHLLDTIENVPAFTFLYLDDDATVLGAAPAILDPRFNPNDLSSVGSQQAISNGGVWRIDVYKKKLSQVVSLPPTAAATHIVRLDKDSYLLSDIIRGNISRFTNDGLIDVWSDDELLKGNPELPGPVGRPPFPVGIEGIQLFGDVLYGVVADHGRIVQIPIREDGSAADVSVVYEDPEQLLGIAHFELNERGNFFAISGFISKVWRIFFDQSEVRIITIADQNSEVRVDTPAQIVAGKQDGTLFFTNNAFVPKSGFEPAPGIIKLQVDILDNAK